MSPFELYDRYFPLSVQLSARAREELALPLEPGNVSGAAVIYYLRQLSARLPEGRGSAGQLNLLARLNTAMRCLAESYLTARRCEFSEEGPVISGRPLTFPHHTATLQALVQLFPPAAVLHGQVPKEFLSGDRRLVNRRLAIIELFLLGVQNNNPAASNFRSLFADDELLRRCGYRKVLAELDTVFVDEEGSGLLSGSLLDLLEAPIKAAPGSLSGQLRFVREQWADVLPDDMLQEIDSAFDVLADEELQRGFGSGPTAVPRFGVAEEGSVMDVERFSADRDWMPQVVLIAKSVYVWLDQLSRQYGRTISRLDQIPDHELNLLAQRGFTALWLIGLWERSPASREIKRMMGNPEAEASAYSLYDYIVADELGGEGAVEELNQRCRQRGIRLACDVVPNHTGIYSRWTREHPEWFVQLDYPPYPNYSFTGPDLSSGDDCSIQIEDGYWDHSDAAVVFKYYRKADGQVRYIYHGNDGTHMPWNDTAQLNFLLPAVREAVIQTILQVARTFKVIRFDAAMTLAKKHFQRLWFPQPGGGAGVPSRAEHWMDRAEFERCFPIEFWREVVDRVAAEVPDTLLLAEAFWLMEEFFVRTLGMHRVYNSAFMHMLKKEENAKYRQLLRNTLEFNPEIMKRFVNFMNNPDEATAVEQFGKGDKYFGAAVMLATLPGLPMWGHGQIEGFAEKYGMEYRRAYWEESVDQGFVEHHESRIFPLLRKRYLFSEVGHFELYHFETDHGTDENVFAYSNRAGNERSLVVYHNLYGDTSGRVRMGVEKARRTDGGELVPSATTLSDALSFSSQEDVYYRYRDQPKDLEYLRSGRELHEEGLFFQLKAYDYHVFLDFQELHDADGRWGELCRNLAGQPVHDLDREFKRLHLASLLAAWRQLLAPEVLTPLIEPIPQETAGEPKTAGAEISVLNERYTAFLQQLQQTVAAPESVEPLAELFSREWRMIREWITDTDSIDSTVGETAGIGLDAFRQRFAEPVDQIRQEPPFTLVMLAYLLLHRIGDLDPGADSSVRSARWIEELLLEEPLAERLTTETAHLVTLLVRHQNFFARPRPKQPVPEHPDLFDQPEIRRFLQVHPHAGFEWFNKECLENLLFGLFAASLPNAASSLKNKKERIIRHMDHVWKKIEAWQAAAEEAGYRWDRWRSLIEQSRGTTGVKENTGGGSDRKEERSRE